MSEWTQGGDLDRPANRCPRTQASEAVSCGDRLRRSAACLDAVFALTQDGLALLEIETGRIIDFNDVLPDSLGCTPEELARRTLFDLCSPDAHEHLRQRLRQLADGGTVVLDVQHPRRDGRVSLIRLHCRRLPAPEDQRLVALCRDTTPSDWKVASARESEEMLRMALEAVSDGLWDWHIPSGTFTRNPGWYALTGYKPDELDRREREHGSIIHPDDAVMLNTAFARHLDGRSPEYQAEFRIRHKSGQWRWLLGRGRVVQRDLEGMPVRVIGTDTDITSRKTMEGRLRQSQRMEAIGQLAGGVAHDFNNILTAVLGNAELLRAGLTARLQPGDPLLECVEQIEQAGERAATLTRQLLAFSRRHVLDLRLLDINAILGGCEKLLRRLVPEHTDLHIAYAATLRPVRADAGQIEHLFVNLVVHARDRMPHGGMLEISTENVETPAADDSGHPEPCVQITVSDTGPTPDPAAIANAFDPLRSLDAGGLASGLGLAAVRGIAEQGGGQVTAEIRPGGGVVLRVLLPARAEADAKLPQPDLPSERLRGTETVLICEDDPAVRRLTCRALEDHGYRVLSADSGPHALQCYEHHHGRIDALLTDIMLPGMTGRELAEELVGRQPGLPVVYVSGYTHDVLATHDSSGPGALLLRKPFTSRELLLHLRQALDGVPQLPG